MKLLINNNWIFLGFFVLYMCATLVCACYVYGVSVYFLIINHFCVAFYDFVLLYTIRLTMVLCKISELWNEEFKNYINSPLSMRIDKMKKLIHLKKMYETHYDLIESFNILKKVSSVSVSTQLYHSNEKCLRIYISIAIEYKSIDNN
ncbi:unnamed protein product [Diatraea saccharalis]|uniref:Uncharacterized protein n=1 Tax=Diatraea saccharalis TaxID=40085 RepID=A0A9N9RB47_9NEOP|nr:unnamed protein product [Diatraea saccharalis]